jgi:hypothetical protein
MSDRRSACDEKIALRDRLLGLLIVAGKMRDQRPGIVDTPYGFECEWTAFERSVMLDEVNRTREARGLGPVDPAEVRKADSLAAGHIDWAEKFALYCAEIALSTAGRIGGGVR